MATYIYKIKNLLSILDEGYINSIESHEIVFLYTNLQNKELKKVMKRNHLISTMEKNASFMNYSLITSWKTSNYHP